MDADGGGSDLSAAQGTEVGQVMLSVEKCRDVVGAVLIHQPVGNHQPHGQPPAQGAAATGNWMGRPLSTGKWMAGSTSTGSWMVDPWPHAYPDGFPEAPKFLGQPTSTGRWRGHSILTTGRATGNPWEAVLVTLVVPAEQCPQWALPLSSPGQGR